MADDSLPKTIKISSQTKTLTLIETAKLIAVAKYGDEIAPNVIEKINSHLESNISKELIHNKTITISGFRMLAESFGLTIELAPENNTPPNFIATQPQQSQDNKSTPRQSPPKPPPKRIEPLKRIKGGYSLPDKKPSAKPANFELWKKADLWTIERAILLLNRIEEWPLKPRFNTPDSKPYDDCLNLWELTKTSAKAGTLAIYEGYREGFFSHENHVIPSAFLIWARSKSIDIPSELDGIEASSTLGLAPATEPQAEPDPKVSDGLVSMEHIKQCEDRPQKLPDDEGRQAERRKVLTEIWESLKRQKNAKIWSKLKSRKNKNGPVLDVIGNHDWKWLYSDGSIENLTKKTFQNDMTAIRRAKK